MEPQTRFDLNVAVENWRNELTAQPALTTDARRELETHLHDTIAELRQRGLNEEESFWLACHRLGRLQQLAQELEKADPGKIWRERVFWMVLAYLAITLWGSTVSAVSNLLYYSLSFHRSPFSQFVLTLSHFILILLPVVVVAVQLTKGKFSLLQDRLAGSLSARRLMVYALGWSMANSGLLLAFFMEQHISMNSSVSLLTSVFFGIIHAMTLAGVLVWLMPKDRRGPERT